MLTSSAAPSSGGVALTVMAAERLGQRLGPGRAAVDQRQMRAAGIEQGGGDGPRRAAGAEDHRRAALGS